MREYVALTAMDRFRYAKKYVHCLTDGNFSELMLMSDDKRAHALKALSALSKFLGVHEVFKGLIKNYGLKWTKRNSDDLIIDRLTKAVDSDDIFEWIRSVKREIPSLSDFMDLMVATGLRYNEAINSYNLIVELSSKGKLHEYFCREREVLEHFKFKEIFLRRGKKAFVSFVKAGLVEGISGNDPVSWNAVQLKVKRKIGEQRFSDIRELHATTLVKYLRQPEIDFIQGRVSTSVFMKNYFNPAWISDLKTRTLKAAEEILKKTSIQVT